MFSWLKRKLNFLKIMIKQNQNSLANESDGQEDSAPETIPISLDDIKKKLSEDFSACSDFRIREVYLSGPEINVVVAFIDNMVSNQVLNENVLKCLQDQNFGDYALKANALNKANIIDFLASKITCEIKVCDDWQKMIDSILSGESAIFTEGTGQALRADTQGWEARAVAEPETETVVRGPREGFVEQLGVNCSMIRRKIRNQNLKMESMTLGKQTNTAICICYLQGIASEELVQEVKTRLEAINMDAVLESGYVEEMIEDAPLSFFPTVGNSEKPDVVAGKLLEGRVAIVCDGTPIVLTVPYLFIETLQTSEDYYSRAFSSLLLRTVRILCFYISILLPALYVAFLCFHQSVLPLNFLLTVTASREGVPFSPFLEAIFMGITFEILQEAGVRMPRPIGQSVSIVGALVIGEASVRAGLVSDPMVIITAITAISTFILPPLQRVLPFFRFAFTVVANILGLLGIFFVLIVMVVQMSGIKSFGTSYLAPLAPLSPLDLKDTFVRFPHWTMLTRPRSLTWENNGRAKYRMSLQISDQKNQNQRQSQNNKRR